MAQMGFPRSPANIKEAIKIYLDKSKQNTPVFINNRPGKTWFAAFLRRNPALKMARVEPLEQARAMSCTKEAVYAWFDGYERFLREHNINSASQIYNCDESGFPLQTSSKGKLITDRYARRNFQNASSTKASITTLHCVFADGRVIPPAVYYEGKKTQEIYATGFNPDDEIFLGFSNKGWMETAHFYAWMTNHFVNNIPLKQPIVLLIDGHSSHIDYYLSKFCAENGILLYRFPPHTSHALQPTDRGYFCSFKSEFAKQVARYNVQWPAQNITKQSFAPIFSRTLALCKNPNVVISSFRCTGIWPVNRYAVDEKLFTPGALYVENPNKTPLNSQGESFVDFSISTLLNSTPKEVNPPKLEVSLTPLPVVDTPVLGSTPKNKQLCPEQETSQEIPFPQNVEAPSTLPGGEKKSSHSVFLLLEAVETQLGPKKRNTFLQQYIAGFDNKNDPLFIAWKELYVAWEKVKADIAAQNSSFNSSFGEMIGPVLASVCSYPVVQRKEQKKTEGDGYTEAFDFPAGPCRVESKRG